MLSTMSVSYRRPSDSLVAVVVLVFVLLAAAASHTSQKEGHIRHKQQQHTNKNDSTTPPDDFGAYDFDPNVTEYWFDAIVDHFNFRPTVEATFKLRYFVNDQYRNNASSPVLFYAGNEADIIQFVKNSGFLWEAAKELEGMVVFCEHRYYGESFPLSGLHKNKTASLSPQNISYLTVEQAMADYNTLVIHMRQKWNMSRDAAFIVTGGSYGANLALWLRLKNANLWAGAIASSATPLKHLLRETNAFNRIVADVYANVSHKCPGLIRQGWKDLATHAQSSEGQKLIQQQLQLCNLPQHPGDIVDSIHGWISNALETMVQYGYPYPTSFYNPVPGYPFKVACENMLKETTALGALRATAQVYYNYTGQAGECFDWFGKDDDTIRRRRLLSAKTTDSFWNRLGQMDRVIGENNEASDNDDDDDTSGIAWGYQCCTEAYQPMPTDGVTDLEMPYTPNETEYFESCRNRWDGVTPRPNWEETTFWSDNIQAGSNIFLSNGQLDPWRAAGIQSLPPESDDSIIVRTIEHGAHHLDLRASHPMDPPSVKLVRQEELQAMQKWIQQWRERYPATNRQADTSEE
jgi:Serine carboxypeptidase S28